jgi:hypothetical protein
MVEFNRYLYQFTAYYITIGLIFMSVWFARSDNISVMAWLIQRNPSFEED